MSHPVVNPSEPFLECEPAHHRIAGTRRSDEAEASPTQSARNARSLDENLDNEDSDGTATLSEYVGSVDTEFDLSLDRLTLATALDTLPAREKNILQLRFYRQLSQRQIAERINISQMHVSRLERGALQKLRAVLLRSSVKMGPETDLNSVLSR